MSLGSEIRYNYVHNGDAEVTGVEYYGVAVKPI